jgi:hypothetical protein
MEKFKQIAKKIFFLSPLLTVCIAIPSFYSVITASIDTIKFRKQGSPVLSAAKVISLTAALVSMLSLETGMLSRYGGGDSTFRWQMTSISGGIVCVFVLGMAVYMIIRSSRNLKAIDKEKQFIS